MTTTAKRKTTALQKLRREMVKGNVSMFAFYLLLLFSSVPVHAHPVNLDEAGITGADNFFIKITGRVLKDDSTPLQGATVSLKGSAVKTQTDANGYFELTVENTNAVIEISYTGFQSVTVSVKEIGADYSIALKPNEGSMDEVVVIGYGTTKKKNTLGAISSVKAKNIITSTNSNVFQALAGKTPGLQAIQGSGQPGAAVTVQLRGNPSYASSGVLYVVDGVIVNDAAPDISSSGRYGVGGMDRSPLNFLNPNDIESIDFIKDASAASIYGARAGGGVMLITTKKGSGDRAKVEYSGVLSMQKATNVYEIFGTREYMEYRNLLIKEDWMMSNRIAPYGNTDPNTVTAWIPRYTQAEIDAAREQNAMDSILRNGTTAQHNISVSGSSGKTRYFFSGNYFNNDGIIKGSAYQRYGSRLNLTQSISNKIRVGINATYTQAKGTNANIGSGEFENAGVILAAIYHPPTIPLRGADGSYPLNPDYANAPNPLSYFTVTDFNIEKRLLGSIYGEWDIMKGLTYRATASYDQSSNTRDLYWPKTFLYGARANGYASKGFTNLQSVVTEHTLNYRKVFADIHSIEVLGGYSYQKYQANGFSTNVSDFLTDNFQNNSLQSGTVRGQSTSNKSEKIWASYFSRVMYSLKDRYLLSASIRRDGASHFALNKKWGNFPSITAGWIVSEESFLKSVKPINFLKLRLAYGSTGNSNIGASAFAFYSPGSVDAGGNYVFGTTENIGVFFSQIANPNLTWERVKELNIGVDLQAFNSRVGINFDIFNKTIDGLLQTVPLTTDFMVSTVFVNAGKTRSKGWEIGINTKNIVSNRDGFSWNSNINFSHYYNSWVERSPDALKVLPKYENPTGGFDDIYAIRSNGIYKGGDKPAAQPNLNLGQVILMDINSYGADGKLTGMPDGKLNEADYVVVASKQPKYNFGITNTFQYKGFDLTIFMYGLKRKQYNKDIANGYIVNMQGFGWNKPRFVRDNGWSSFNQDADFPNQLSTGTTGDFWYEDASFLRCRDIMLGYTLPATALGRQKVIKGLRVSFNLQNAFIITNYSGLDPELNGFVSYPNPKSIVFGINASF